MKPDRSRPLRTGEARRASHRSPYREIGRGLLEPALHLASALNGGWFDVALSQDHLLGHRVDSVVGRPDGPVLDALVVLAAGELSLVASRVWTGPPPPSAGPSADRADQTDGRGAPAFLGVVSGGRRCVVGARLAFPVGSSQGPDTARSLDRLVVAAAAADGGPVRLARVCPHPDSYDDDLWRPIREVLVREARTRSDTF